MSFPVDSDQASNRTRLWRRRAVLGALVAAPFHRGERGHPVGFGAACYAALAALTGDEGAKTVVAAQRDRVVRVEVDDAGILRDVDTPSDLG